MLLAHWGVGGHYRWQRVCHDVTRAQQCLVELTVATRCGNPCLGHLWWCGGVTTHANDTEYYQWHLFPHPFRSGADRNGGRCLASDWSSCRHQFRRSHRLAGESRKLLFVCDHHIEFHRREWTVEHGVRNSREGQAAALQHHQEPPSLGDAHCHPVLFYSHPFGTDCTRVKHLKCSRIAL